MKFNIRDIGDEGLAVRRVLGPEEVRALLDSVGVDLVDGRRSMTLDLALTRAAGQSRVVLVQGLVQGEITVECARCLGPASIRFGEEGPLRLTYLPKAAAEEADADDEGEPEEAEEDVDTYVHDGLQIDLDPLLREQVILAIPITPLCREDCKGICPACGADLNTDPCRCAERGDREEHCSPGR